MLKRIKLIRNVGKFYDCHSPGIEFGKETIMYGRNGDGKSTLTSVFRSLATNNPTILKGRKSFGANGNKRIELVLGDTDSNEEFIFENLSWNRPYSGIHIFDSSFIYENIYEGESIGATHRSNLYRVIIGASGKLLMEDIEHISESIKSLEQRKRELVAEFSGSTFGNHYSLEDFIDKVPQDHQIDEKIKEKEREINFSSQLSKPGKINIPALNIKSLKVILGQSFKSSHEAAERRLLKHIEDHWRDTTESKVFIRDGLSRIKSPTNLKDSQCPFCGQPLFPVTDLIKSYRDYFNEEYKKFRAELLREVGNFKSISVENLIISAESVVNSWSQFLGDEHTTIILSSLAEIKPSLLKTKTAFEEECDKKIQDLNRAVEWSELESFSSEYDALSKLAEQHNEKIKKYMEAHAQKPPEQLKSEIGRLRTIKSRHTEKWVKFCSDWTGLSTEITQTKQDRDRKIDSLSTYTKDALDKHQILINDFLGQMAVDFKIAGLSEQRDLRRSSGIFCGYEIEFFSRDRVPLENSEDKPSMKNCLSHGDKSALAFAFFLSIIGDDTELNRKIVIFDDPISSFDKERKRKTAHLLFDVISQAGQRPEQLIVMTHETQFLRNLYYAAGDRAVRYIKICPDGITPEGRKKSRLDHCNIYEEFLEKQEVKQLKRIKQLAEGNSTIPEDARGDCRNVIEAVFKIKYYLELEEEVLSKKSIRGFVDKLCSLNIAGYDGSKKRQLFRLFDDLHVAHHSEITQNPSESSTGDLRSILRDTLQELRGL